MEADASGQLEDRFGKRNEAAEAAEEEKDTGELRCRGFENTAES